MDTERLELLKTRVDTMSLKLGIICATWDMKFLLAQCGKGEIDVKDAERDVRKAQRMNSLIQKWQDEIYCIMGITREQIFAQSVTDVLNTPRGTYTPD